MSNDFQWTNFFFFFFFLCRVLVSSNVQQLYKTSTIKFKYIEMCFFFHLFPKQMIKLLIGYFSSFFFVHVLNYMSVYFTFSVRCFCHPLKSTCSVLTRFYLTRKIKLTLSMFCNNFYFNFISCRFDDGVKHMYFTIALYKFSTKLFMHQKYTFLNFHFLFWSFYNFSNA